MQLSFRMKGEKQFNDVMDSQFEREEVLKLEKSTCVENANRTRPAMRPCSCGGQ